MFNVGNIPFIRIILYI